MASNGADVVQVTESFKSDVKEWLRLTQQKSQVAKDMKLLNGRLKELKEGICQYMASNRLDACNVRGGKVQLYTTKSKEPLNKDTIKTSIASYMANKEGHPNNPMAGEMADFIIANRAVKEKHSLRRSGGVKDTQGGNDTATSELRAQPEREEEESSQDENDV